MIDENGFRLNVGIILTNSENKLFWGQMAGKKDAWQFPQGGIHGGETPEQAMYRELYEEIGLAEKDVQILGQTQEWFCYLLPKQFQRAYKKPFCIGQKQKWFLLRLLTNEKNICFNRTSKPEFAAWRWINYWDPPKTVIAFKREVYESVLQELEPLLK